MGRGHIGKGKPKTVIGKECEEENDNIFISNDWNKIFICLKDEIII